MYVCMYVCMYVSFYLLPQYHDTLIIYHTMISWMYYVIYLTYLREHITRYMAPNYVNPCHMLVVHIVVTIEHIVTGCYWLVYIFWNRYMFTYIYIHIHRYRCIVCISYIH